MTTSVQELMNRKAEARAKFEAMDHTAQELRVLQWIEKRRRTLSTFYPWPAWDAAIKRVTERGLIEGRVHLSSKGSEFLHPTPEC